MCAWVRPSPAKEANGGLSSRKRERHWLSTGSEWDRGLKSVYQREEGIEGVGERKKQGIYQG